MRSALKIRSAIKPITNGAMIAPQDCVENAMPICPPLAPRLLARNVPRVTNHPPQIKNCRNIMALNRAVIMVITITVLLFFFLERGTSNVLFRHRVNPAVDD
ncbi:hypothetical protein D3C75_954000 [compost metagenome]